MRCPARQCPRSRASSSCSGPRSVPRRERLLPPGRRRSQSSSRTDRNSRKSRVARRSMPGTLSKSPTRTCRALQRHSASKTQRFKDTARQKVRNIRRKPASAIASSGRPALAAFGDRISTPDPAADCGTQETGTVPPAAGAGSAHGYTSPCPPGPSQRLRALAPIAKMRRCGQFEFANGKMHVPGRGNGHSPWPRPGVLETEGSAGRRRRLIIGTKQRRIGHQPLR